MKLLFLLSLAIVGSIIGIVSFGSGLAALACLCSGNFHLVFTFGIIMLLAIAAEGVLGTIMVLFASKDCAPKEH